MSGAKRGKVMSRAEFARLPFDEAAFTAELGVRALHGEPGYSTLERLWARPTLEINGVWGGTDDYGVYAAQVEALFLPPHVVALEEYGVPIEVGRRLTRFLLPQMSLDEVLAVVRRIPADRVTNDAFERELLQDAQKSM